MNNPNDKINLSVQDTLRLIAKMLREGHDPVAANLSPAYLEEAAQIIDNLVIVCAELKRRVAIYDTGGTP